MAAPRHVRAACLGQGARGGVPPSGSTEKLLCDSDPSPRPSTRRGFGWAGLRAAPWGAGPWPFAAAPAEGSAAHASGGAAGRAPNGGRCHGRVSAPAGCLPGPEGSFRRSERAIRHGEKRLAVSGCSRSCFLRRWLVDVWWGWGVLWCPHLSSGSQGCTAWRGPSTGKRGAGKGGQKEGRITKVAFRPCSSCLPRKATRLAGSGVRGGSNRGINGCGPLQELCFSPSCNIRETGPAWELEVAGSSQPFFSHD